MEGGFDQIDEKSVYEAINFAKDDLKKILDFEQEIIKKIGKTKLDIKFLEKDHGFEKELTEIIGNRLENALFQKDKAGRNESVEELKEKFLSEIQEKHQDDLKTKYVKIFCDSDLDRTVHENVIKHEKRV